MDENTAQKTDSAVTPVPAFKSSRKTARSPAKESYTPTPKRALSSPSLLGRGEERNKENMDAQAPKRKCIDNVVVQQVQSGKEDSIHKLGKKIKELEEMISDKNRRSINQVLRDVVSSIAALYETVTNKYTPEAQHNNQTTQTTPTVTKAGVGVKPQPRTSTSRGAPRETKTPVTDKETTSENDDTAGIGDTQKEWKNVKSKKNSRRNRKPTIDESGNEEKTDRGRDIQRERRTRIETGDKNETEKPNNNRKDDQRRRRARPDVIVIEKTGDITYADILKTVRGKPELKDLGERVDKIRRTAKGELCLQLKNVKNPQTQKHKADVAEVLKDIATVKMFSHEMIIECRDLDEITTADDICNAIAKDFPAIGNINVSNVKSLRTLPVNNTQIALISLPIQTAKIMLDVGHIRVGWVRCRIRERITPTRCYKCLDYGHLARKCTSETDRSKLCYRCGTEGHKAKMCNAQPKCLLCNSANHASGSYRCPPYKRALEIETVKTRNG